MSDGEPDETEDGVFEPEGWWEDPVEIEHIEFIADTVTHWQPLPQVMAFGAVGDGIADDTNAIQDAINAQQGRMPAAEASGSDDAKLQAAYAEGRKDEREELFLSALDDIVTFGVSLLGHASETDGLDESEAREWVRSRWLGRE